jgi:hypothetical protein
MRGGGLLALVFALAAFQFAPIGCAPKYRSIPPPGHTDADISLDIAYCGEEQRGQFETVESAACLQGRGWTLEPIPSP